MESVKIVQTDDLISENDNNLLKLRFDENTQLDSIAIDGLTYRDIFETYNSLGIDPGFVNNTWDPLIVPTGVTTPELVSASDAGEGAVGDYVLKITEKGHVGTSTNYSTSAYTFIAANVKCTRYSAGSLGVTRGDDATGAQVKNTTDGFVVVSNIANYTSNFRASIGAYAQASLDGYVDMPVVVPMSIFTSSPSKDVLTELYRTYLEIKKNGISSKITSSYRTLINCESAKSLFKTSNDWMDLEPYFTQIGKKIRWSDGAVVDQLRGYIAVFKIHANQQIEILSESTAGLSQATQQAVIAHSVDGETWVPDERGYHDSEDLYYNHFGHTYDEDCYVALSGLYGPNYATPKFRVKNLPLPQNTQTEFSCENGIAVTGDSTPGVDWYFVTHGTTSIKGALFYIPLNPESRTIRFRIINPFENIKFNTQMVYGVKGHWAFRTTGSSVTITNNEFTLNHDSADTLAVSFVKSSGTITEEELAAIKLQIVYEGRARSADGNTAFMSKVQEKVSLLGMTNSTFVNPYGGSTYGYNVSTVRDLMKMTVHAMDYRELKEISTLTSYTVQILGPNARTVVLTNNLQQTMDNWYQSTRGVANPYTLLLQKPGGWSSGAQKGFSLCAVTKVGDVLVAASTGTTDGTGTTGRECRWRIMLDLFDICKKKLDNTYAGETLTYNDGETEFSNLFGCACILPSNSGSYGNKPLEILYEQNADVQFNPASCSKMIASMVMIDTVPSLYETHNIRADEIVNDSNYVAQIEDIEDMYTSLAIMYLASNGSNTLSAARYCGEKILAEQQKAYPNLSIG